MHKFKRLIMAFDLKIEIFAHEWFCRLVLKTQPLACKCDDECLECSGCNEVSDCEYLYYAIMFRRWFFEEIYLKEIKAQINEFRYSQLDFCCYVLRTCNRVDLFGNLTIFERVFATSAFVWALCCYCFENGYSEIANYGDICWIMYFDNFAVEFYEQGGWDRLKMVAISYKSPIDFSGIVIVEETDNTMTKLRKAIESYQRFKKIGKIDHDECITTSWIKFYTCFINGSFNYNFDDIHSKKLTYNQETEKILKQLKYLCDPNGSEVVRSLGQITNIDSSKSSMTNLNISDKHVNPENITDEVQNVARKEKAKRKSVTKTAIPTEEKVTKIRNGKKIREENGNNQDECKVIKSAQLSFSKRLVKKNNTNQDVCSQDQDKLNDKKTKKDYAILDGRMSYTGINVEKENTGIACKRTKHENSILKENVDKNFFRMLLVLGDKQGISNVLKKSLR